MGLEVQSTDLVHALFRLWCLRGLQFRFWFLGNTKEYITQCNGHRIVIFRLLLGKLTTGPSWSVFSIHVSRACKSLGPWYLTASSFGLYNFNLDITHVLLYALINASLSISNQNNLFAYEILFIFLAYMYQLGTFCANSWHTTADEGTLNNLKWRIQGFVYLQLTWGSPWCHGHWSRTWCPGHSLPSPHTQGGHPYHCICLRVHSMSAVTFGNDHTWAKQIPLSYCPSNAFFQNLMVCATNP